jgi:hypothetical protein
MGHSRASGNDLIRVTVIDYLTEEVLLDNLVLPNAEMVNYKTEYSGVTPTMMRAARQQGTCILGIENARAAVLRFVGPQTVVMGHAVHNDFNALHWIHPTVVDTLILEQRFQQASKTPEDLKREEELKEARRQEQKREQSSQSPQKNKGRAKAKGGGPTSLKTVSLARLGQKIQQSLEGHDSLEDARAASDIVKWHVQNETKIQW